MSDQNSQDSTVVRTDADLENGHSAKVNDAWQLATGTATSPVRPLTAEVNPALTESRIFVYASVAATIGIAAGLAIASLSGHAGPRGGLAASASANSNATALATLVKTQATAPSNVNTPMELPVAQTPADLHPAPLSHRKSKKKELYVPVTFAIEGDDELVGYDTSNGVIQTSARKTFLVSTATVGGNSTAWQEWPTNIHYKCDLNASCTLTRKGGAVLYAQLKK